MTHCLSLERCTKTHTDDSFLHSYCFVVISAFPYYFVAFHQRFIYEYMYGWIIIIIIIIDEV